MSLIAFPLKNSSGPTTNLQLCRKLIPPQVFPLFFLRNFKIGGTASVVESHFSKFRETSTFCNSVEKNLTRAWYFRKIAFLEISRSPLLTGVTGLPYSVCNATKNKLLTKFLQYALKLIENFQEVTSTECLHQKCTDLQTAALRVFKAPKVKWSSFGVPFFRSRCERVLYRTTAPNIS